VAADPYVYPGTDVLRNLLDLRDAAELAEREAALSAIRIAQLERRFIGGDFDLTQLQATHRYIFGDVYSLAQVLAEERQDPPPSVLGRLFVVAESGHVQQRRQRPDLQMVEKAVTGLRVLLDVVPDAE
jgi:hypothetical protein